MTSSTSGERGAAVRHAQRTSGQVAALPAMIASGRPFPEVAQQLLAGRGSLDSLLLRLVEIEVQDCVPSIQMRNELDEILTAALGRTGSHRRTRRRPACSDTTPFKINHQGRTLP